MASWKRQEKELTCPVCHDIFKHPVILPCSHSFCKACLKQRCAGGNPTCPVCKTNTGSQDEPTTNLALKNLCENFLEERSHGSLSTRCEMFCTLHGEKLSLLCLDDEQLACRVCQHSAKHDGHEFKSINKAATCYKENLQKSLNSAQEKLEDINTVVTN